MSEQIRTIFLKPPVFNVNDAIYHSFYKDTQSKKLAEKYNLCHLTLADMFKAKYGTLSFEECIQYPAETGVQLIKENLETNKNCKNGFLLETLPYGCSFADKLGLMLEEQNLKLTSVVDFDIDESVLHDRISSYGWNWLKPQKTSGLFREKIYNTCVKPQKILYDFTQRHFVEAIYYSYRIQTAPLIDYYQNQNLKVCKVDVGQEKNLIWDAVQKCLSQNNNETSNNKV